MANQPSLEEWDAHWQRAVAAYADLLMQCGNLMAQAAPGATVLADDRQHTKDVLQRAFDHFVATAGSPPGGTDE